MIFLTTVMCDRQQGIIVLLMIERAKKIGKQQGVDVTDGQAWRITTGSWKALYDYLPRDDSDPLTIQEDNDGRLFPWKKGETRLETLKTSLKSCHALFLRLFPCTIWRTMKIEHAIKHEHAQIRQSTTEPIWVRWLLIVTAIVFLSAFLLLPLLCVFLTAFSEGLGVFVSVLTESHSLSSIRLTLLTALLVVPLNIAFGLAAAWCLGKFEFRGKGLLITLIDIPFAVSPVIAGLLFILLFGAQSTLGGWLNEHNVRILYAFPGIVLATLFVTCPFVVRELLPIMQAQGTEEELAARVLGARGWQIFWRVTLPNVKWGLLYGAILCNARAMGEFGAVAVVSGKTLGQTCTIPLQIEVLHQDPSSTSAPFALAAILAVLAMITLIVKTIVEWRTSAES